MVSVEIPGAFIRCTQSTQLQNEFQKLVWSWKKKYDIMQGITNKIPDREKKKGYSLHSKVDWNVKETVRGILRRCTYFEVCYQIAWNLCSLLPIKVRS